MPQEKLSLTSTVILLLVKLIYRERIMGEGLNAPLTISERDPRVWEEYESDHRETDPGSVAKRPCI